MGFSGAPSPLITIILLCYRHEEFVAEAIRGILSQNYSPLEVLIFDDSSTDRTAEVIESTLRGHTCKHDVRFIRNPENMGPRTVGRMGLGMAKGELIFVSHGDDVMLPNMIEEMATVWQRDGVSLVTANAYYIDEKSRSLDRTFRDPNEPADDSFETLARDGGNACCFGPAIGFEREIYEKFGWVPDSLRGYDVIYPFYAYVLKGACFIHTPLLHYRVHGHNTSLSLKAEKAGAYERAIIEERIYLNHLAHATFMEEELDRLQVEDPERYCPVAARIKPLLNIQLSEMAKKLVRVSRQSGSIAFEPRR
ncbi:MAG: glycosyltransferase family 2 protein [Xanthobacteraceae bacterium]